MLWPANLQLYPYIVQVGYMKCGRPSGQMCNDVAADGKQHFIYACNPGARSIPVPGAAQVNAD